MSDNMQPLQLRVIRVFVVAAPMYRWGLQRLFESQGDHFQFAGSAASLEEAHHDLGRERVDVLLADLDDAQPGRGTDLMRNHQMLALSSHPPHTLHWALLSGLRGVVRKTDSPESYLKAIRKVHEGELWIDRIEAGRLIGDLARRGVQPANAHDRERMAALTNRERQTIEALTSNVAAPAKVIASGLHISENTLRNHLTSIYAKLDLQNRLDLYAYATRHGIEPTPHWPRAWEAGDQPGLLSGRRPASTDP